MNLIKRFLFTTTLLIASSAFANNDYDANYYEDEGSLLFKIRGFYMNTSAKLNNLPAPAANTEKPGDLVKNGYGFDTATTFFFTDNIATELSLGVGILNVKKSALQNMSTAFGNGNGSTGKNNDIFFVPFAATVQYHVAPFGAIRPYVGGGYHGAYMYTRSKAMKLKTGHGGVLQAGIDFIAKDDTLITFDVRQYFLKSKITFKKGFLSPGNFAAQDITSKATWNPLVISVGLGFKF